MKQSNKDSKESAATVEHSSVSDELMNYLLGLLAERYDDRHEYVD